MMSLQNLVTWLVLSLTALQILVLLRLAFFPYMPDSGFSTINLDIYAFLAPLSTVFLLGLLYVWLFKLATREACRNSQRFERFTRFLSEPFRTLTSSVKIRSLSDSARTLKIISHPRLLLAISLAASVLIALVPYRPDLNPTKSLVGIDSPLYVYWINQMTARPFPLALQFSFVEGLDGSRPLLLLILYTVASLGVSPTQIVEYAPALLAPLLSLSTYTFVRFGHGNQCLAGLTALLTPFSFYVTVGLWGGYDANMLALVFVFLFLTLLLLFSKRPSAPKYSLLLALSVALFLTHPWTWILIVTVGLVFAASLWRETGHFIHLKSMIGIITTGIALDLLKSIAFATQTVVADAATKLPTNGQVVLSWTNLVDGLLYTHGGLLGNWIILALGLVTSSVLRFKDWFERLVLLWVGIASIPFLMLDNYNEARIVYDLPLPVLMSTGLVFFLLTIGTRNNRTQGVITILILVLCANYALQGVQLP